MCSSRSTRCTRSFKQNTYHCCCLLMVFSQANAAPEVVEKPGDSSLARLKLLYTRAKELSETEVSISNSLVSQLEALLPPGPPGQPRRRIGKGKVHCFGYSSI
ncbi:SAGA-associated factor 29 homolog B-like isoform X3 [Prosopis cineraria]|uniref:SAGA-associated factor 29 homolog B-like isoform X3 n=1 Tax=Prosopis cineraria TaxID=364024 RepID=UPI0024100483|nr:SAGA-associated factor 29 homolog B-like isoform X3 [Prosopis cineraria]